MNSQSGVESLGLPRKKTRHLLIYGGLFVASAGLAFLGAQLAAPSPLANLPLWQAGGAALVLFTLLVLAKRSLVVSILVLAMFSLTMGVVKVILARTPYLRLSGEHLPALSPLVLVLLVMLVLTAVTYWRDIYPHRTNLLLRLLGVGIIGMLFVSQIVPDVFMLPGAIAFLVYLGGMQVRETGRVLFEYERSALAMPAAYSLIVLLLAVGFFPLS